MPSGVTNALISSTISTVPKMAGNTPPSVFDSRGSSNRNSQMRPAYVPTFEKNPIRFGERTRTTSSIGSSFCFPPSTENTTVPVLPLRSSASFTASFAYSSVSFLDSSFSRSTSGPVVFSCFSRALRRSRIFSCSRFTSPISPFIKSSILSACFLASGRRTWRASMPFSGPWATVLPSTRTSMMKPKRLPFSRRSTRTASAGSSRETIFASSTQTNSRSAPKRSRSRLPCRI